MEKRNYQKTCEYFDEYSEEDIIKIIADLTEEEKDKLNEFENNSIDKTNDILKILSKISEKAENLTFNYIYNDLRSFEEDEIKRAVSKLDKNEKKTLNKNNTTMNELFIYNTIISKIKFSIINEKSKHAETIFMICNEYSKENVMRVINDLDPFDKKIIELRYGQDLEYPIRSKEWTKENSTYFHDELIPKILKKLDQLDKPISQVKVKVKINPVKKVELFHDASVDRKTNTNINSNNKYNNQCRQHKSKNLLDLFIDIEEKDLLLVVDLLSSKQKEAIYFKHGNDLKNCIIMSPLETKKYQKYYEEAIYQLNLIAGNYKISLFEQTNIDKDLFMSYFEKLTPQMKSVLIKVHGKEFSKTMPLKILTSKEKALYLNAIDYIKSNKEIKESSKLSTSSSKNNKFLLGIYPNKTLEELKSFVKLLTPKQQEAIYARFGSNLDSYIAWNQEQRKIYSVNYRNGMHNLNLIVKEELDYTDKLLTTIYSHKTLEELKEAVRQLPEDQQEAIYARYGTNLDTYIKWGKEEYKKYNLNYKIAIMNLNLIISNQNQNVFKESKVMEISDEMVKSCILLENIPNSIMEQINNIFKKLDNYEIQLLKKYYFSKDCSEEEMALLTTEIIPKIKDNNLGESLYLNNQKQQNNESTRLTKKRL